MARRRSLSRGWNFLTPPTQGIFLLSAFLGFLGIVSHFVPIQGVTENQFWLVSIAFILLVIGVTTREL